MVTANDRAMMIYLTVLAENKRTAAYKIKARIAEAMGITAAEATQHYNKCKAA